MSSSTKSILIVLFKSCYFEDKNNKIVNSELTILSLINNINIKLNIIYITLMRSMLLINILAEEGSVMEGYGREKKIINFLCLVL